MAAKRRRSSPTLLEHLESRLLFSNFVLQTLASFGGTSDRIVGPSGPVAIDANGNFFGSTQRGGSNGAGTIYALQRGSTTPTLLASFTGKSGSNPSGVTLDANGNLFGTTVYTALGTNGNLSPTPGHPGIGDGTVFEYVKGSRTVTTLATFDGANGRAPVGTVAIDAAGDIFGATSSGGADNAGTVFEVVQGSNTITTLASFNGANGRQPSVGVVMDSAGNLFGTTRLGGASDVGTVFEVAAGSGVITTLASFNRADGALPASPLLIDSAGDLFGSTAAGGAHGQGTVYEIPAGGGITTLASFNGINGSNPIGPLVMDADGNLFGAAHVRAGAGNGNVYEIAQGSGTVTPLASFSGPNGGIPQGLAIGPSGALFGAAQGGGINGFGTIFRVVPATPANPGSITTSVVRTTLPTSVVAGTVVNATASVVVADQVTVSGAATVRVYASPDGQVNESTPLIGSGIADVSIRSGIPFGISVRIISLPPNLASGTYTLLSEVVDPTGNTAVATSGPTLQVSAAQVALQPSIARLTLPTSLLSGAKTPAVATIRITNVGNIVSKGALNVALFLSPDAQVSDGTPLTTAGGSFIIDPAGAVTLNVPIGMIPVGLNGVYALVAVVTDPLGGSLSTSTGSIFTITPAAVTLSATIDAFRPATLRPNFTTPGSVTITLINSGDIAVGDPLNVNLNLVSPDGTSAFALATFTLSVLLSPGQTRTLTLPFTASNLSASMAGTWFPMVVVTIPSTPYSAAATSSNAVTIG